MSSCFNRLMMRLIPFTARQMIRFLGATMRIEHVNYDDVWSLWEGGRNVIVAFWHGRLMMMPLVYRGKGMNILVSHHRDGELVARTVKGLGIDSVRGSSTRGWFGGVKGLLRMVKEGRDIAITPDGPKGPRYKAQMGVIQIARATGLPIVPMTFGASKKKPSRAGTPLSSRTPFPGVSSYAVIPSR
ncbi:MAG: lysophospholipid acyltransferase family protein [Thermodesulfobacteriota bacterium]